MYSFDLMILGIPWRRAGMSLQNAVESAEFFMADKIAQP